ncbi:MAG TPA: PQQ-binding-like beta-propeller repeat protein, partial [Pirellulales bacterium]|nr:PQQ-binding-like beta-propeller repeat protein [Pirellulales bacterium]
MAAAKIIHCSSLAIVAALAISAGCPAAEPPQSAACDGWPAWRGAAGDGIAAGCKLPTPWPDKPLPLVWEAPLKEGWSSPVVAEGRLFITDRDGGAERLLAFDAESGRPLWQLTNLVDFDPHAVGRRHGNGPKSTPVVAGGRVYSLGIAGWLQCVDARSGEPHWQMNLPAKFGQHQPLPSNKAFVDREENVIVPVGKDLGAPVPLFGYTGSPLVRDGRLICPIGQPQVGTVAALDGASGKIIWHALEEHVSYSSPIVAELAGVRQVVLMTGPRVVGLAWDDGRL